MKRTLIIALACALGLALTAPSAQAISLIYQGTDYLGYIDPSVPADPADEAKYINALADYAPQQARIAGLYSQYYSRVGSVLDMTSAPNASGGAALATGSTYTVNAAGYLYILAKYGNEPALVWYNPTGFTGSVSVPDKFILPGCTSGCGGGISHIDAFNFVPDGGATLMFLGGALVGLGALRRKFGA